MKKLSNTYNITKCIIVCIYIFQVWGWKKANLSRNRAYLHLKGRLGLRLCLNRRYLKHKKDKNGFLIFRFTQIRCIANHTEANKLCSFSVFWYFDLLKFVVLQSTQKQTNYAHFPFFDISIYSNSFYCKAHRSKRIMLIFRFLIFRFTPFRFIDTHTTEKIFLCIYKKKF